MLVTIVDTVSLNGPEWCGVRHVVMCMVTDLYSILYFKIVKLSVIPLFIESINNVILFLATLLEYSYLCMYSDYVIPFHVFLYFPSLLISLSNT